MVSQFDRAYYRDSYRKSLETTVIRVDQTRHAVVLDDTVFYPEGGGQPGDTGRLKWTAEGQQHELHILDTQADDQTVYHLFDPDESPALPAAGTQVEAAIDWARRFELMQQHSAEHIVSGLAHQLYGAVNVGFHISRGLMTCDFDIDLSGEALEHIIEQANLAVWSNIAYEITYPEPAELEHLSYRSKIALEDSVRLVTVPGYDRCACSGTQVRSTGELGQIRALDCQHYKGGCRIELVAGIRALRHAQADYDALKAVGQDLSVPPARVPEAVDRIIGRVESLASSLREARQQLLEQELTDLPDHEQLLFEVDEALDLKRAARQIAQSVPARYAALQTTGGRTAFVIGQGEQTTDGDDSAAIQAVLAALQAETGAKGGGRGSRVSGSVDGDGTALRGWLKANGWLSANEGAKNEHRSTP